MFSVASFTFQVPLFSPRGPWATAESSGGRYLTPNGLRSANQVRRSETRRLRTRSRSVRVVGARVRGGGVWGIDPLQTKGQVPSVPF